MFNYQGTGTLANDVVAAQLSLIGGKGLILVNGEFGWRLTDHAKRFGMKFDVMENKWGGVFDGEQLTGAIGNGQYSWVWVVHCETSTGVLNHLGSLKRLCQGKGIALALDCVSSIGTVPVNLADVTYASGVSGKGLSGYTGLSFVFHNEGGMPSDRLPRYLDLGAYMIADGIPYSQSSNLLFALDMALQKYETPDVVFARIELRAQKVRKAAEQMGLTIIAPVHSATPVVLTIEMPEGLSAIQLGDNLYLNNFDVHYESGYLRERNWLQIACMNDVPENDLERLLNVLHRFTYTAVGK